jgi:Kef-type K+ transport system membrane component KefB
VTLWLIKVPGLFSEKATMTEAVLFMGAAMSITAFPMLARIIYERGTYRHAFGNIGLGRWCNRRCWGLVCSSGSAGELRSWPGVAVKAIVGGVVYAVIILTIGKKLLSGLGRRTERDGKLTPGLWELR